MSLRSVPASTACSPGCRARSSGAANCAAEPRRKRALRGTRPKGPKGCVLGSQKMGVSPKIAILTNKNRAFIKKTHDFTSKDGEKQRFHQEKS